MLAYLFRVLDVKSLEQDEAGRLSLLYQQAQAFRKAFFATKNQHKFLANRLFERKRAVGGYYAFFLGHSSLLSFYCASKTSDELFLQQGEENYHRHNCHRHASRNSASIVSKNTLLRNRIYDQAFTISSRE